MMTRARLIASALSAAADDLLAAERGVIRANLLGNVAAAVACSFAGETEEGSANRGPAVDYFHAELGYDYGKQWCSIFVFGVWTRACELLTYALEQRVSLDVIKSSGAVRGWHKNNPRATVSHDAVRDGDVRLSRGWQYVRVRDPDDRDKAVRGSARPGHTGIVLGADNSGTIYTIEGNTSEQGEDANGGGVYLKTIRSDDPRLVGYTKPRMRYGR